VQVGVQLRAVLHVVVELGEGGAARGAKESSEDQKLRYRSWISVGRPDAALLLDFVWRIKGINRI
jgi:hypothetical protein